MFLKFIKVSALASVANNYSLSVIYQVNKSFDVPPIETGKHQLQ